jgi:hypothetical protein
MYSGEKFRDLIRKAVYEKYNGHCAYCGAPITQRQMQVDHIKSVHVCKLHGVDNNVMNSIDNYMPSCRQCNLYKDTLTIEQFREKLISELPSTCQKDFKQVLAIKYGIIKIEKWDGVFYFEKQGAIGERRQFDLNAAKHGARVCMKNGTDVRIVCFDVVVCGNFKIMLALAMGDNGGEVQYAYDTDGTLVDGFGENDERTLVMKY